MRHPTEAAARMALENLWKRKMYRGDVYRCKWCDSWHVGRK